MVEQVPLRTLVIPILPIRADDGKCSSHLNILFEKISSSCSPVDDPKIICDMTATVERRDFRYGVKSDGLAMSALLPLYPRKPTFNVRGGMSQKCPDADFESAVVAFRRTQARLLASQVRKLRCVLGLFRPIVPSPKAIVHAHAQGWPISQHTRAPECPIPDKPALVNT
jgi:hypothetical protein